MQWFAPLLRIGATLISPAAPLLQFMAELDAAEIERRLQELEDPISTIHPNVPELAKQLYTRLPEGVSTTMDLEDDFVARYWRPLHLLDGQRFLELRNTIGTPPRAISRISPIFVGYMAQRAEDGAKMRAVAQQIECCEPGQWLNGKVVSTETGVPLPVVRSIMQIYESGGYGIMSQEIGAANYCGRA